MSEQTPPDPAGAPDQGPETEIDQPDGVPVDPDNPDQVGIPGVPDPEQADPPASG